jgi:hypothetical protein
MRICARPAGISRTSHLFSIEPDTDRVDEVRRVKILRAWRVVGTVDGDPISACGLPDSVDLAGKARDRLKYFDVHDVAIDVRRTIVREAIAWLQAANTELIDSSAVRGFVAFHISSWARLKCRSSRPENEKRRGLEAVA